MDISTLAATLVGFLAPALPYLVKGGEKALEAVGEKVGEDVWERAKAIWQRLRGTVEASPGALEAVQDLAREPDDGDAQGAVRLQLKKLLSSDEALADELARLLEVSLHYFRHFLPIFRDFQPIPHIPDGPVPQSLPWQFF